MNTIEKHTHISGAKARMSTLREPLSDSSSTEFMRRYSIQIDVDWNARVGAVAWGEHGEDFAGGRILRGRKVPGGQDHHELADEPAQAWQPQRGKEDHRANAAVEGHRLVQAAEVVEVAVVGPIVDDADAEEHAGRRD